MPHDTRRKERKNGRDRKKKEQKRQRRGKKEETEKAGRQQIILPEKWLSCSLYNEAIEKAGRLALLPSFPHMQIPPAALALCPASFTLFSPFPALTLSGEQSKKISLPSV